MYVPNTIHVLPHLCSPVVGFMFKTIFSMLRRENKEPQNFEEKFPAKRTPVKKSCPVVRLACLDFPLYNHVYSKTSLILKHQFDRYL